MVLEFCFCLFVSYYLLNYSFSSVSINWTKTSALNVFTNLLGSVCKDDADCVRFVFIYSFLTF
jgi:hypothetical protein